MAVNCKTWKKRRIAAQCSGNRNWRHVSGITEYTHTYTAGRLRVSLVRLLSSIGYVVNLDQGKMHLVRRGAPACGRSRKRRKTSIIDVAFPIVKAAHGT